MLDFGLDVGFLKQLEKVKYYFKIFKNANVVWAYFSCSFLKYKLCCCIFKGRGAV